MKYFYLLALLSGIVACHPGGQDSDISTSIPDEEYTGGKNATTFDFGENAFGITAKGFTIEQDGAFVSGNSLFRSNWVTAPASVQSMDGLGPLFNEISCGSCHFKDGRAMPPESPDAPLHGLLFRLSIPGTDAHGGPLPDPVYGGQLQDKAILNVQPEGQVRVSYEELPGNYADGDSYSLRRPIYQFHDLRYGDLEPGWLFSARIAQQLCGMGLLELVASTDILSREDPADHDGDGISGRANQVWDERSQQSMLGRFGWKAGQPSLIQQAVGAFNGDIGITSSIFPEDQLTSAELQTIGALPNGGSPEISDDLLDRVETYLRGLSVPARRDYQDREVLRGKLLFNNLNCSGCHYPQWKTADAGDIDALKNQVIWPYTDLLLHDMGTGLADGRPEYLASGSEWRTPPLWGIGLIPVVNGHQFLLHDGRARSIEEAILWHGGEAEQAVTNFKKLSRDDRKALVRFVNSL